MCINWALCCPKEVVTTNGCEKKYFMVANVSLPIRNDSDTFVLKHLEAEDHWKSFHQFEILRTVVQLSVLTVYVETFDDF